MVFRKTSPQWVASSTARTRYRLPGFRRRWRAGCDFRAPGFAEAARRVLLLGVYRGSGQEAISEPGDSQVDLYRVPLIRTGAPIGAIRWT